MNKHLLALFLFVLIAGSTIYGIEQTMPLTRVGTPVCTIDGFACDQTKSIAPELDKILSTLSLTPEQKDQLIRLIIEQAQQQSQNHAQGQSWLARHKTLLIGTAICTAAIATNIVLFMARKKAIAKLTQTKNKLQEARSQRDNAVQQKSKSDNACQHAQKDLQEQQQCHDTQQKELREELGAARQNTNKAIEDLGILRQTHDQELTALGEEAQKRIEAAQQENEHMQEQLATLKKQCQELSETRKSFAMEIASIVLKQQMRPESSQDKPSQQQNVV